MEFAEIERIASRAGVPLGALIRGWLLAGLASERGTHRQENPVSPTGKKITQGGSSR